MLGRGVGDRLGDVAPRSLVSPEIAAAFREADLAVLNLECCVSERGSRWPGRGKPFFFRAPPRAVELLVHLGVDCVTLANNHALDFGADALLDTFTHLDAAGIEWVGAGPNLARARRPALLTAEDGGRLAVLGATDHPDDFAATPERAGVAHFDLDRLSWLLDAVQAVEADAVLVTPHWGPNMQREPLSTIRRAAHELVQAGATLVAGHSAHVFQGVAGPVLYDLGDFIDDYRRDPQLRNDLGLLWFVELAALEDEAGHRALRPARIEALPLQLEYAHTRLATGDAADWVERRLRDACAELGTEVEVSDGRLIIDLAAPV
jgi:poly-gamma-glutamate capsule biosynthesis protein CapA/YwtB (metallophosphatase superfamily)